MGGHDRTLFSWLVTRYLPRPVARTLTRLLQRSVQRTWIPVRAQRGWTEAASRITRIPPGLSVSQGSLGGVPCDRIGPPDGGEGRAILYLHGGAYVVGSRRTHRGMAAQIALALEEDVVDRVVDVEYTLTDTVSEALLLEGTLMAKYLRDNHVALQENSLAL